MKILLINIRYAYVGGPERYLFNLKEILEQRNHKVIPFSIRYPINEVTEFDDYFVSPLSDDESVYFKDQRRSVKNTLKTLERNFYSKEVELNLSKLISDEKPDFAIVLLYLRKLSPAVLVSLSKGNVPFIVRLSDFSMVCPSHNLYRNGSICEKCLHGRIINSVVHKCVHNSYLVSFANYLATKYHYNNGYFKLIPHFVCPSKFLIRKMVEAGWSTESFSHLPTFTKFVEAGNEVKSYNQLLYAGRIEHIKGIHHLIEGFRILQKEYQISVKLILAGSGDQSYIDSLKQLINEYDLKNIYFTGNLSLDALNAYYQESSLSIVPSLVYDNMPNSALESMAFGTPVIAPNNGSFPEIVKDGISGFLYEYGKPSDMAIKIRDYLVNQDLQRSMPLKSREFIKDNHSSYVHYNLLMSIVQKVMTLHKNLV